MPRSVHVLDASRLPPLSRVYAGQRFCYVQVAERFYHCGMLLQQVANFYNTIASQMLECHKPCLLARAQAFEALCLQPTDTQGREIRWTDAAALENYLARLDSARRALVDANSALRARHAHVGEQLALLARLDLTTQRDRWLRLVDAVRRTFTKCEDEFPRDLQVRLSVGCGTRKALQRTLCCSPYQNGDRHALADVILCVRGLAGGLCAACMARLLGPAAAQAFGCPGRARHR